MDESRRCEKLNSGPLFPLAHVVLKRSMKLVIPQLLLRLIVMLQTPARLSHFFSWFSDKVFMLTVQWRDNRTFKNRC